MTEDAGDWLSEEEAIQKIMAEYGVDRDEAEAMLAEFDAACPWAVEKNPLQ